MKVKRFKTYTSKTSGRKFMAFELLDNGRVIDRYDVVVRSHHGDSEISTAQAKDLAIDVFKKFHSDLAQPGEGKQTPC